MLSVARIGLFLLAWSGCADLATIGALCPADCTFQTSDRVCDCQARSAGRGGSDGAPPDAAVSSSDAGSGAGGQSARDAGAGCSGNLIVALDGSASLLPWWPALSDGFQRFIQDDASRGLGVGLLSFADVCDTTSYLPPLVPLGPLPENLPALQANIPTGAAATTSTIPVLSAALQYGRDWLRTHPDARVSVLLITDASPGVCDGLSGMYEMEVARIASDGFTGNPAIATYAIGGDSLPNIGPLASAGGTKAIMIQPLSSSDDVLAALRGIRAAVNADACSPSP